MNTITNDQNNTNSTTTAATTAMLMQSNPNEFINVLPACNMLQCLDQLKQENSCAIQEKAALVSQNTELKHVLVSIYLYIYRYILINDMYIGHG